MQAAIGQMRTQLDAFEVKFDRSVSDQRRETEDVKADVHDAQERVRLLETWKTGVERENAVSAERHAAKLDALNTQIALLSAQVKTMQDGQSRLLWLIIGGFVVAIVSWVNRGGLGSFGG